jgi:uncharacterized protein (TIGR02118 family)
MPLIFGPDKEVEMAEARLVVLYPHPTDTNQFDRDYREHLRLLRQKLHLPEDTPPYTVTRFTETARGKPLYYQMFLLRFPTPDALEQALNNPAMKEVAADAVRISSGGAPVVVAGVEMHIL